MVEQSAQHFTCLTAKYCLKTWQEQHTTSFRNKTLQNDWV